ncbi:hypothetical protein [Agrobacterium sp. NPDC089420]|uniref:hypothetical protein n=1 Tax=Agrobacterium sp. NPDC089420 TaxID=3363918 RepID=UPI0038502051
MAVSELSDLLEVDFDTLQLDPNNPRIAPRPAPGYADVGKLFDKDVQASLTQKVFDAYNAEELEKTITSLGWAPVDPIIVWRHPSHPEKNLVVEGNTRTSILRRARKHLEDAKTKLAKLKEGGRQSMVTEAEAEVKQLQKLVDDTKTLKVQCVLAKTPEELKAKLPRLLGVRHVSGAKDWSPYATNIYISDLYEEMFIKVYPTESMRLVDSLIKEAAQVFSLSPDKARRRIQASSMFDHFKLDYEDKIKAAGNALLEEDQYFFDQILQSKYARSEFDVDKDTLKLSEKSSGALFQWAFSKPRKGSNENVFRKAEDMRVWQSLSKYDNENSTTFAAQLDVDNPVDAPTLKTLNNRRGNHEEQMSPLQTISSLIETFEKLPASNLITQSDMLQPMLIQVRDAADRFLAMIEKES